MLSKNTLARGRQVRLTERLWLYEHFCLLFLIMMPAKFDICLDRCHYKPCFLTMLAIDFVCLRLKYDMAARLRSLTRRR